MNKKFLWLVVSGLMALSLVMAACSTATTSTTSTTTTTSTTSTTTAISTTTTTTTAQPASDKPQYGGTLYTFAGADTTIWDYMRGTLTGTYEEQLFQGDWAKGPAGGYGTNQTDWAYGDNDIFDLKTGYLADSVKWSVDAAKTTGTIVYEIKQGVHFGLNPKQPASVLVNGRQLTADDVVLTLQRACTWPQAYVYLNNADLRTSNITKTGPWEVTCVVPYTGLVAAVSRFNDTVPIQPHEVWEKYGDLNDWTRVIGTGAWILTDVVTGSEQTRVRNPNYWLKNPVGPGKGDQLPYIDSVKTLILVDTSTQQAAFRTGKLDVFFSLNKTDSTLLKKNDPQLLEQVSLSFQGRGNPQLNMRTDYTPFNDVRVRRAMCMCIDYNNILQNYWGGEGQIYTFPYSDIKEYHELYLPFSEYSDLAKSIYTYNVDGAKKLLADAGYPNGFKTTIICMSTNVDFYSIYKDYLSKIGIDMAIDVRDPGVFTNIYTAKTFTQMISGDTGPVAVFYNGQPISGLTAQNNRSQVNDPYINDQITQIKSAAITDIHQAMSMYKNLTKYVVEQAYAIPAVTSGYHTLWWPWLKNYSGEQNIGYDDGTWPQFIWIDQDLKKSMGH